VQALFDIDMQDKAMADLLERSGIACGDGMLIIAGN
jgi:hypothetical protein